MLNYLWAGMILVGIVYGAFNGKMPDITNAALDSAKEAVTLCITMIGYHDKFYRKFPRTGLGGDARRIEGDGRAGEAGG